jgi:hypothetical protein
MSVRGLDAEGSGTFVSVGLFRALKAPIAIFVGIALWGLTSSDWSLAGGCAAFAAVLAVVYWFGHVHDPQRRW